MRTPDDWRRWKIRKSPVRKTRNADDGTARWVMWATHSLQTIRYFYDRSGHSAIVIRCTWRRRVAEKNKTNPLARRSGTRGKKGRGLASPSKPVVGGFFHPLLLFDLFFFFKLLFTHFYKNGNYYYPFYNHNRKSTGKILVFFLFFCSVLYPPRSRTTRVRQTPSAISYGYNHGVIMTVALL